MYSNLFIALSALTTMVNAQRPEAALGVSLGLPTAAPLARRAADKACATSVLMDLMPPSPKATKLAEWVSDSNSDLSDTLDAQGIVEKCEMTVPASLSEDYLSYLSVVRDWAETLEDDARDQTDCGFDQFSLSFTKFCTDESLTVFFTTPSSSGDSTKTSAVSSTVIPSIDVTSDLIVVGAASSQRGMAGLAALVAVAGSVVLLM